MVWGGLAILGAMAAAEGDVIGQIYSINRYQPPANACSATLPPTYNPYQTLGAAMGGLIAGLFPGGGMAPIIAGGQMSFMTVTAGAGIGMKLGQ